MFALLTYSKVVEYMIKRGIIQDEILAVKQFCNRVYAASFQRGDDPREPAQVRGDGKPQ